MALKAGRSDSVDSLIRQAGFWASFDMSVITPGYRVRAAGPKPSLQFGLGADDLRADGSSFVLDLTTGQVSGLTTADNQLEPFWAFQAGQGPAQINLALKVKNKTKDGYYLNTGLLPFETFDIIFNFDPSKPQVTLVPVPAPAPLLQADAWAPRRSSTCSSV